MRVVLRADASVPMGSGHLRRCLALAHALRALGAECLFVCRHLGMEVSEMVRAEGFEALLLPPQPTAQQGAPDPATDAADTLAALAARGASRVGWMVVDHYALDARWHRPVAQALGCRLAAIDDLGDRDLAVDVLIDPNPADNHQAKYAHRLRATARLLGGARFALLGPAYASARRNPAADPVRSIGIFMGGTDAAGLSVAALRACREGAAFNGGIEVVTTRANPRHTELAQLAQAWPLTAVTLDLPDLAAFFARHELHIGAGGGASWERCCIGAPTLALQAAANQTAVLPQLERLGVAATLGQPGTAADLAQAIRALLDDATQRRSMAQRALALVDGYGARRVAATLLASTLHVRAATVLDSACMHAWRNHALTRAVSTRADEVVLAAHEAWLAGVLADPRRRLLVGCIGEQPVGVIRFDRDATACATVSLYLDPAVHGLGLGTYLLAAGERAALAWAGVPLAFSATVLDVNAASQRLFAAAGYVPGAGLWRKPAVQVQAAQVPGDACHTSPREACA